MIRLIYLLLLVLPVSIYAKEYHVAVTGNDTDLAATGWDVTGATAVVNIGHQFFTWTRMVEKHTAGSEGFSYSRDLGKSIKLADESGASLIFNDNRYYLVGKKEFLDIPDE